jgi:hypothetical protein
MQKSSRFCELLRRSNGLQFRQLKVNSLLSYQFVMSALLYDLALIKDVYHVSVLNRTQTMRNRDGGAPLCCGIEGSLYNAFRCRVEG